MIHPDTNLKWGSGSITIRWGDKALMRKQESGATQVSATRPESWGRLLRREAALPSFTTEQAGQMSRVVLLALFGSVALIGFAMQAKGALMQLMAQTTVQKAMGVKENKEQ